MVMITVNKPVEVSVTTIEVYMKVTDTFAATFKTADGVSILEHEGYVPGFMPGEHYGDYLILTIDLASGKILNWKPVGVIESQIRKFFNEQEEFGNLSN